MRTLITTRLTTTVVLLVIAAFSNANEAALGIAIGSSVYESDRTSGGEALSVEISLGIESNTGTFHKISYGRSVDAESSPSSSDTFESVRYQIGRAWYPRSRATDHSIWSGIAHWRVDDQYGIGGVTDRTVRALYLPFGYEAGLPIGNTRQYFVFGGEGRVIVNGVIENGTTRESNAGGYGYGVWLGFDFRIARETILETRLVSQAMDIELGDYSFQSNELIVGLRF